MHSESTTKTIPLTRGLEAIVDAEDYQFLSSFPWFAANTGYAQRNTYVDRRPSATLMHRWIMLPDPDQQVDHINGDRLDNRRCNLRVCTMSQNRQNQAKAVGCSSRYKGVYRDQRRGNWRSYLGSRKSGGMIGRFSDEVEAALAYDLAAICEYGEFARPNFLAWPNATW